MPFYVVPVEQKGIFIKFYDSFELISVRMVAMSPQNENEKSWKNYAVKTSLELINHNHV